MESRHVLKRLSARHRRGVEERRAIDNASSEMARAGVDQAPRLNPMNRIRAFISGQGM